MISVSRPARPITQSAAAGRRQDMSRRPGDAEADAGAGEPLHAREPVAHVGLVFQAGEPGAGRVFDQRPQSPHGPQHHPDGDQQEGDADKAQAADQQVLTVQPSEPGGDVGLNVAAREVVGDACRDDEEDRRQCQANEQDFGVPDGLFAHRLEGVRFQPPRQPAAPDAQQAPQRPEDGQGGSDQDGGDQQVGGEGAVAQAVTQVREDVHVVSGR